jgi:hypothetical protein
LNVGKQEKMSWRVRDPTVDRHTSVPLQHAHTAKFASNSSGHFDIVPQRHSAQRAQPAQRAALREWRTTTLPRGDAAEGASDRLTIERGTFGTGFCCSRRLTVNPAGKEAPRLGRPKLNQPRTLPNGRADDSQSFATRSWFEPRFATSILRCASAQPARA